MGDEVTTERDGAEGDPGRPAPDPEVLDCTLRDGGYYTEWDFEDDLVTEYLDAMEGGGVDYVEIGYRSRPESGFYGRYKFCREHDLERLFEGRSLRCAVMADAKEFLREGTLLEERLEELFPDAGRSTVELVRVATTAERLPDSLRLIEWLAERGYSTSVNLMRVSLLGEEELSEAAGRLEESSADFFYLADSYGAMSPDEVRRRFGTARAGFSRSLGAHCHENFSLALANSLAAVDEGADVVDCTVTGIGRGAGNLPTELLLLYLRYKGELDRFRPGELVDVVARHFEPMKSRHGWGTGLAYMLSAAYNVHPSYPHKLLATRRYGSREVVRVLEALKRRGVGDDFDRDLLGRALKERTAGGGERLRRVPDIDSVRVGLPSPDGVDEILLVGSGPSVEERGQEINELIEARQPLVLECNHHPSVRTTRRHLYCFTNHRRLSRDLERVTSEGAPLLTGLELVEEGEAGTLRGLDVWYYPYRVQERSFEFAADGCVIPYDVVAMYALAAALELGVDSILLAGFDGYLSTDGSPDDLPTSGEIVLQREMEDFFRLVQGPLERSGVEMRSVTPTSYDIPVTSLYALY